MMIIVEVGRAKIMTDKIENGSWSWLDTMIKL